VTLVAARAEADGVVVGRLAEGVLPAVGGFAGVSAAAGNTGLTGDAVLIAETAGSADASDTVESIVAVPRA